MDASRVTSSELELHSHDGNKDMHRIATVQYAFIHRILQATDASKNHSFIPSI